MASQKKTKIPVKRCITASKPRALLRSNKSPELASNTLLDWFLVEQIILIKWLIIGYTYQTP